MNDTIVKAASPDEIRRALAIEAKRADAAVPPPEFVSGEGREITVPLQFPVKYKGVVYNEVTIRRPVMREWRAYMRECQEAIAADGPGADDAVDQPWVSIPARVLEELDFVDATKVEAAQDGFFVKPASQPEANEEPRESE